MELRYVAIVRASVPDLLLGLPRRSSDQAAASRLALGLLGGDVRALRGHRLLGVPSRPGRASRPAVRAARPVDTILYNVHARINSRESRAALNRSPPGGIK